MSSERDDGPLRLLAGRRSQPRQFKLLVGLCVVLLAVGTVAAGLSAPESVNWFALLFLGAMFVTAENRDRLFPDETGLSASISVALASALYFGFCGWVGGAFLICICGGLYRPHLRERDWTKIVVNSACFGVSALAAATVVSAAVAETRSALALALACVLAAGAYWVTNCIVLALATTRLRGGSVWPIARQLIVSDIVMLVFAVGGALCGLVMVEVGPWVGIAALAAALVALDVFVISVPAGPGALRAGWKMLLSRIVAAAAAGVTATAIAIASASVVVGIVAGVATGMAVGLALIILIVVLRIVLADGELDVRVIGGVAAAEVPLLVVACCAGVAGAEAGVAAGIVCGSILIVVGALGAGWWRTRDRDTEADDDLVLAAVTEAIFDGLPDRLGHR